MLRHGYDETNGIVIGEITTKHVILYDGRKQFSWTGELSSDWKVKEISNQWIKEKKEELGRMLFNRLYPDDKWELRIYN